MMEFAFGSRSICLNHVRAQGLAEQAQAFQTLIDIKFPRHLYRRWNSRTRIRGFCGGLVVSGFGFASWDHE